MPRNPCAACPARARLGSPGPEPRLEPPATAPATPRAAFPPGTPRPRLDPRCRPTPIPRLEQAQPLSPAPSRPAPSIQRPGPRALPRPSPAQTRIEPAFSPRPKPARNPYADHENVMTTSRGNEQPTGRRRAWTRRKPAYPPPTQSRRLVRNQAPQGPGPAPLTARPSPAWSVGVSSAPVLR